MEVNEHGRSGRRRDTSSARAGGDRRLPHDLLRGALALALWVTSGSLVLAIADGLGEHPARRLLIGVALTALTALALWRSDGVATVLQACPWLVCVLAAVQLTGATADGVIGGAYVAVSLTSIGIACVVARDRTVWLTVALLAGGYTVAVLSSASPSVLIDDGQLGGTLGALISYPVAAVIFLALRWRFTRFVDQAPALLQLIRGGDGALTAQIGLAIGGMPLALPAPAAVRLTASEVAVVEALAGGASPKQLAHERGLAVATVRTHIANAKRKTGARTLRELASLPHRPQWREYTDRGH